MTKRMVNKKTYKIENNKVLSNELRGFLIILLVVFAIITILYFVVAIFITKDIKIFNNQNPKGVIIQGSNILVTETFTMKDKEYYVLFYDEDSADYTDIKAKIDSVTGKKIYKVDLGNAINQTKIGYPSNKDAQVYSDLKINGNTLIKIVNKSNVLYVDNKDEIINSFNE